MKKIITFSHMEFIKYGSITNCYRQKEINFLISNGHTNNDIEWVATEKIHGANFSFYVKRVEDGELVVLCGKRNSIMDPVEYSKFFNSLEVFKKYEQAVKNVYLQLDNVEWVIIYGELFGGAYNNIPKPTPTTKCVQSGIYYCPHNDFFAFDIRTNNGYMDYDSCAEICKKVGLNSVKALFRGEFKDVMNWSSSHNADNTSIPSEFGLDPIDNNQREGHVLKPVINRMYDDNTRIILKDKNNRFDEISSGIGFVIIVLPVNAILLVVEVAPIVQNCWI